MRKRGSEFLQVLTAAAVVGSLLVGDRAVPVVAAVDGNSDRAGLVGDIGVGEIKAETAVVVGDTISFRIVHTSNDVDSEMCRTRPTAEGWNQCIAFVGLDDRFVNSQPITERRDLGILSNGDYVEAWVERDGQKFFFDTRKVTSIVPAEAEGMALYDTSFSNESDLQPPYGLEGEMVTIEYNDGSKILCRYRPGVGAMREKRDIMGNLERYVNWEEGLFMVVGVRTHGGNCNTGFAAENLKSVTVGNQRYIASKPFNGASLRGLLKSQDAARRPVFRRVGRK